MAVFSLGVLIVFGLGVVGAPASAQEDTEPFGSLDDVVPPEQAPPEQAPPAPQPEQAPPAPPPEQAPVAKRPPEQAPGGKKPAAEDESKVETLVVTAQFREQDPQDTPLAITAVDAEMLEQRSQTDIAEVANQTPNVRLSPAPGTFGPSLQAHIRGIGQHDFNYALEPGVGIYVDDVYYSTLTGSILDLLDLERVEILRGPQGTLMGQNSIGGAIRLYSRPPDGEGGGYVQTTYGRYNRTEIRGGGDFTVVDDMLFGRVAGVGKHKDGYVTR